MTKAVAPEVPAVTAERRQQLARKTPVSCGTLVMNKKGELLLCHATGTSHWDIPKGMPDSAEGTLDAAMRELREETGLAFNEEAFEEIGCFDYRPNKRLHLYRVKAPEDFDSLEHLACTSYFPHAYSGKPTPEVDGYRWATREDVEKLCWPRMAARLLSLDW